MVIFLPFDIDAAKKWWTSQDQMVRCSHSSSSKWTCPNLVIFVFRCTERRFHITTKSLLMAWASTEEFFVSAALRHILAAKSVKMRRVSWGKQEKSVCWMWWIHRISWQCLMQTFSFAMNSSHNFETEYFVETNSHCLFCSPFLFTPWQGESAHTLTLIISSTRSDDKLRRRNKMPKRTPMPHCLQLPGVHSNLKNLESPYPYQCECHVSLPSHSRQHPQYWKQSPTSLLVKCLHTLGQHQNKSLVVIFLFCITLLTLCSNAQSWIFFQRRTYRWNFVWEPVSQRLLVR